MTIEERKKEIEEMRKNLSKDEYDLGGKEHQLREQASSMIDQADRIERHLRDAKELIRLKEKSLQFKVIQEQRHNELLEGPSND